MNVAKSKQKIDALANAIKSLEVLIKEHDEKALLPVMHSLTQKKNNETKEFINHVKDKSGIHVILNQL
jgi:hypothetical protein